jgi:O-methyltransferase
VTTELHYAEPMRNTATTECDWYHTVDIPGHGLIRGGWDLRDCVDDYLGNQRFAGRSVIEIGPASGFLTTMMEKRGASVTAVDTPLDTVWEFVPRRDRDISQEIASMKRHIPRIRRGWWHLQNVTGGSARMLEIGAAGLFDAADSIHADICLIGALLAHVRHPIDVLETASRVADRVIVTQRYFTEIEDRRPFALFGPEPNNAMIVTWWFVSMAIVRNAMGVFGFKPIHEQRFFCTEELDPAKHDGKRSRPAEMYCMVFEKN